MLSYLHVKNFALINELEIDFNKGLTVLTGETGAGKSIIIGSMNAISGNKLDKNIIRSGEDFALVEMIFEIDALLAEQLKEQYDLLFDEEHSLLLSRRFNATGRSVYRVNSETVTATVMNEITEMLIDIHSQHDHQSLLRAGHHIDLLDQYIGKDLEVLKSSLSELYGQYRQHMKQIKQDALDDDQRRREMDFLNFEIEEITLANLVDGEDVQLQHDFKLLSNQNKIVKVLSEAYQVIEESPQGSITDKLGSITSQITSVKQYDTALEELYEEAVQVEDLIRDLARDLNNYLDSIEMDHMSLDTIEKRLHVINSLKSKYGDSISDILESLKEKQESYEYLSHYEENIERIKKEVKAYEDKILTLCGDISAMRQSAALHIAKEITAVLEELNFNNCLVKVEVTQLDSFSANGFDQVTILISTNKNEPVKPLNQIASGGELSRVMLALKSVFANQDDIGTMVFDEIDTGISGRTAQKVAEKMAHLSKNRQIICITHLPQISAMADAHYLIDKLEVNDRIETSLTRLTDQESHEELARLIGGAVITKNTLESAKEMKDQAVMMKERF